MIKKINLTDFVVLIFLVLSGTIILSGKAKTEHFAMLIGARIIAVATVFMLIKVTVDRFEGDKAILRTSDKQNIVWPKMLKYTWEFL